MLPRSCFLELLSKSNSSTRLPSITTPRVSSGWAASMSILLVINLSGALHGPGVRAPATGAREDADRPRAAKCGGGVRNRGEGGAAHVYVLKARVSDGRVFRCRVGAGRLLRA